MDKENPFNERFKFSLYKLSVSYDQKDQAKELGARWSPEDKFWFLPIEADRSKVELAMTLGFNPTKHTGWNDALMHYQLKQFSSVRRISSKQKDFIVEAICYGLGPSLQTKANLVFIGQGYRCPWCEKSKGELLSWSSAKQRWGFACYLHNYSDVAVCSKCHHEIKSLIHSKGIEESDHLSLPDLKELMAK